VELGSMIRKIGEDVAPPLTSARLSFENPLPTYPHANPYKPRDELMEKLISEKGEPYEPALLSLTLTSQSVLELAEKALRSGDSAATLNPLIQATFLEPLSLAAYHQSIRHRTVPTAVESIYRAAERALRNPEKNAVKPPKISESERLSDRFHYAVERSLETYRKLVNDGVKPSDAVYILPQSLRIYVVRTYNAFNLLWPQGYIGTRACSYAQWEERSVAYAIWRAIEKKTPELASLMGEKCKMLGYCPERKWCPIILKYRPYSDKEHAERLSRD